MWALLPWRRLIPWIVAGSVALVVGVHYRGVRAERAELRDLVAQQRVELEALQREHEATLAALEIARRVMEDRAATAAEIEDIRQEAADAFDVEDGPVAPVLDRALGRLDQLRADDDAGPDR